MRYGQNVFVQTAAAVDFNAAATIIAVHPGIPIWVVRFGYMATVAVVNTTALILTLRQDPLGAVTASTLGTITGAGTDAIGEVHYSDTLVTAYQKVYPGTALELAVTQGATSGNGHAWIEYTPLSFSDKTATTLHIPEEHTS